ncbi:MAG: NAD-dependent epimerase/dehydratase family protein [Acidobacteriota bacterium]|nr:NAD-dependent epimerase/dehydratase family protein [Blastocatellia bacterium]MDW8413611.1 NAD-dependent epimerase/dehydratase family protein [Acidobacteriota bacterium]
MITGKKVFLTGGAGFIGAKLAARLVEYNNKVTIYDNFARNSLKDTDLALHPNVRVIQGDVLDYVSLRDAIEGHQLVVHLAGIAGIDTVLRSPVRTFRVNLLGTANVCEAVYEVGGCERLIDFSSSEVFGQVAFRLSEADPTTIGAVGEQRWNYAISKLAAEHLTHAYFKEYGVPTVSVRPFNIYGPGQVGEGALQRFVLAALAGSPMKIFGDGSQIRSWCFVDDFVDCILLCLERPEAVGQVFNIGNPQATVTVLGLAETIKRLLKSESAIEFVSRKGVDVELRVPNIDKARALLGFEPRVGLEAGILRTAEWYSQKMK